jgi:hypothetical protein
MSQNSDELIKANGFREALNEIQEKGADIQMQMRKSRTFSLERLTYQDRSDYHESSRDQCMAEIKELRAINYCEIHEYFSFHGIWLTWHSQFI